MKLEQKVQNTALGLNQRYSIVLSEKLNKKYFLKRFLSKIDFKSIVAMENRGNLEIKKQRIFNATFTKRKNMRSFECFFNDFIFLLFSYINILLVNALNYSSDRYDFSRYLSKKYLPLLLRADSSSN